MEMKRTDVEKEDGVELEARVNQLDNFEEQGTTTEDGDSVSRRLIRGGHDDEPKDSPAVGRSAVFRRKRARDRAEGSSSSTRKRNTQCCALVALALVFAAMIGVTMLPRNSPKFEVEVPPGENEASYPVPRENMVDWMVYHNKLKAKARDEGAEARILLLGDSITEEFLETSKGVARPGFGSTAVWKDYYGGIGSLNLGVSGDQTQHLLWRIQNGELPEVLQPESVMVAIGTNNLGWGMTAEDTVVGIKAVVKYVQDQRPNALVCVMALFPRSNPEYGYISNNKPWDAVVEVNKRLEHLLRLGFSDSKIRFVDCYDRFLSTDAKGEPILDDRRIMNDNLHLTAEGLKVWAECVSEDLRSGLSD